MAADSIRHANLTIILAWRLQSAVTRFGIKTNPLSPDPALSNRNDLLALPCERIIGQEANMLQDYVASNTGLGAKGNLVPDALVATILRQQGLKRIYTADRDFC